ncbi:MAG: Gfo/Idh/MocA family oxidoreductase [Chloroflexota bacterium]
MATEQRIRIGVVGLGLIAQAVHLPNLQTLRDRFVVTHVCDLSRTLAEAIAADLPGPARISTDWRSVCDDPDVDAVLVMTPGAHGPQALGASQAGKHVLSEKPLSATIREAREIEATARAAGRVLQVGYMKMYDPAVAPGREALATLGDRRVVRVTVLHPANAPQFAHVALRRRSDVDHSVIAADAAYEAARADEALPGATGPLRSLYLRTMLGSVCHELSLMRALAIPLPRRFAFGRAWPFDRDVMLEDPSSIHGVADLGDGSLLELTWAWLPGFPDYAEELAVFGPAGRIRLAMPGPYLPAHRARLQVELFDGEVRRDTTYRAGYTTAFVRELEAFADSVADGAPVLSGAAGAAADIAVLQELTAAIGRDLGVDVGTEAVA